MATTRSPSEHVRAFRRYARPHARRRAEHPTGDGRFRHAGYSVPASQRGVRHHDLRLPSWRVRPINGWDLGRISCIPGTARRTDIVARLVGDANLDGVLTNQDKAALTNIRTALCNVGQLGALCRRYRRRWRHRQGRSAPAQRYALAAVENRCSPILYVQHTPPVRERETPFPAPHPVSQRAYPSDVGTERVAQRSPPGQPKGTSAVGESAPTRRQVRLWRARPPLQPTRSGPAEPAESRHPSAPVGVYRSLPRQGEALVAVGRRLRRTSARSRRRRRRRA